jgi:hypothetical protein
MDRNMNMKNVIRISILVLAVFAAGAERAHAQGDTYIGTSAANFLKVGIGAKAVGMAEAYVTMSDDATSLYWNPGAISRIDRTSIVFSTLWWLVDTHVSYAAVTMPFSIGTVGFDVSYFGSGDIEETTLAEQDGTGRVVSASDLALGLAYARNFTDRFSVGIKFKYIHEQLASVSASAMAFDIGSVFTTNFLNDLRIGINLANFGGDLRFDGRDLLVTHVVPGSPTNKQVPAVLETSDWPLPLFLQIGIATDAYRSDAFKATLAYSVTDSRDHGARHNLGAALTFLSLGGVGDLALRGGYRFLYDEVTFSAGAGVQVSGGSFGKVTVDYAYTDFGRLKGVHQLTLGLMFD